MLQTQWKCKLEHWLNVCHFFLVAVAAAALPSIGCPFSFPLNFKPIIYDTELHHYIKTA